MGSTFLQNSTQFALIIYIAHSTVVQTFKNTVQTSEQITITFFFSMDIGQFFYIIFSSINVNYNLNFAGHYIMIHCCTIFIFLVHHGQVNCSHERKDIFHFSCSWWCYFYFQKKIFKNHNKTPYNSLQNIIVVKKEKYHY